MSKTFDVNAERNFLRALLLKKDVCNFAMTYKMLRKDHFTDLFHLDVWNSISEYYDKYGRAPSNKKLRMYLLKNITYRQDVFENLDVQKNIWINSIPKLYKNLPDDWEFNNEFEYINSLRKKRIVQKAIYKATKHFNLEQIDSSIKVFDNALENISTSAIQINEGNLIDDIKQHLIIDKQIKNGDFGKPTKCNIIGVIESGKNIKILKLDDYLDGGWFPGEFYLIIGETNLGKSFTLSETNYAAATIDKINSIIFTIEMNKIKQERRMYVRGTGIPYYKFKKGELDKSDRNKLGEWKEKWKENKNGIIQVVSFDKGAKVTDIKNKVTDTENKYGEKFGLISVDYINDLQPEGKYADDENGWKGLGNISWNLALLAKHHNNGLGIPVISAIQKKTVLYRKAKTDIGSGAGSALPEHHATVIIGLGQTLEDKAMNRIRVDIPKNRDGDNGASFYIYPDFAKSRISSIKKMKEFYGKK